MNFKTLTVLLILFSAKMFSQIKLSDNIFSLEKYDSELHIDDVIKLDSQGFFNKPYKIETYKSLKNKEAGWNV